MNLLLITADDMSYSSMGLSGCEFPNITPTIDNIGSEGIFFTNAHATIGLCQPARSAVMTGLYPWNNGALGFEPIYGHVTTMVELLKSCGYKTGIIGKPNHLTPHYKFPWDQKPNIRWTNKLGKDRNFYYRWCSDFFKCKSPFFLMSNSHFPHRAYPETTRYNPEEVRVPNFLPDTREVRNEISQYYEGVTQCDLMVESIILALEESGHKNDTLVVFTSDHGMSFPFIKANCYHFSSKIPLIMNFPGALRTTNKNMISSIDIMPTVLQIMGIECPDVDGTPWGKDIVYTCLCKNYTGVEYETRAIHDNQHCYIKNMWHDGQKQFHEDGSLDGQPSVDSIKFHTPETYHRLRYRSSEEFYKIDDNFSVEQFAQNQKLPEYKLKMLHMAKISKDKKMLDHEMNFVKLL